MLWLALLAQVPDTSGNEACPTVVTPSCDIWAGFTRLSAQEFTAATSFRMGLSESDLGALGYPTSASSVVGTVCRAGFECRPTGMRDGSGRCESCSYGQHCPAATSNPMRSLSVNVCPAGCAVPSTLYHSRPCCDLGTCNSRLQRAQT